MASVLYGLSDTPPQAAVNSPSSAAPAPAPAATAPKEQEQVPDPSNFAAAAKNPAAAKSLAVIKSVALGQLPGVLIPHDAPKIKTEVTPQDIANLGVGIYKPAKTKGLVGVLYNAKRVPLTTLKALDKSGRLHHAFPPITSFLGDAKAPGSAKPAKVQGSAPGDGATPSDINNFNLTGSPAPAAPQTVPVLPKPSFSADASKQTALKRMNVVAGNTPPSARPIPGGGAVLNGLLQPAI